MAPKFRSFCPLTRTDLEMADVDGQVEEVDGIVVVRRRNNPGYYWGNYLLLPAPPQAAEFDDLIERSRNLFDDQPEVKHVLLRWDGASLSETARERATELEMTADGGVEMIATALVAPESGEVEIRQLDLDRQRQEIVALNIACDSTEEGGSAEYRLFKERIRNSWWVWQRAGIASWWGAYIDGGLVRCSGCGRFQAVETHPSCRRRGVCSSLVAAVGNRALTDGGCRTVVLGADDEGPALALYRRLGFEMGETQRSLLLGGEAMRIRSELPADRAEVEALVRVAFARSRESQLIEALAGEPGVISLVAERAGTLLGHLLFSPVTVRDADGSERQEIALGPIAVRPSQQGRGVGTALIDEGLQRCRQAGWKLAFVLGDPGYYQRFGWLRAADHRLNCRWDASGENFQVLELVPGGLAGCQGQVVYHCAFDAVG